jgi:hypothetical protein
MPRLADALLTTRGVVAFWVASAAAFVLMLCAISPGSTLQDALTAELLQGHLAGGYQLRNLPLYEWLLWTMQHVFIVPPGSEATNLVPYAALAEELTQRGLGSAQFVTLSPR